MNHWLIFPVLLPAFLGPLMILWMRHDLLLQRAFGLAGGVMILAIALRLGQMAGTGDVHVYRLGNWAAPFGIVLVLDRLAALMLVLTAVLALVVQLYAIGSGWDRKGWHFHALWMFQLMGLNGAFLTGDAFNLFVFFEVLLIASYGLMIHGGGPMRLRAGVQYMSYNLAGSALFLAALGALYAVTGTLNMADMALRVAQLPPAETALLRTGAVLLMLVFAIKAALFPLHFWLPSTYANAPGPVAALFAIMSKVGVYAMIRFFTMVFPQDTVVETLAADILLPAALITLAVGQIGVLGTRNISRLAGFAAIASIGTLMIAVSTFDARGLTAGMYYMIHSTLAGASLFLIVDMIAARRGGDVWLRQRPSIRNHEWVSALFFVTAIAIVGLPPLSGFLGKLLILDATAAHAWMPLIWTVILVGSVIALLGFVRAGSMLFWKAHELDPEPGNDSDEGRRPRPGPIPTKLESDEPIQDVDDSAAPWLSFVALSGLLLGLALLALFAGPLTDHLQATAQQLTSPAQYLDAVLNRQEGAR